jgi:hypothetical protein
LFHKIFRNVSREVDKYSEWVYNTMKIKINETGGQHEEIKERYFGFVWKLGWLGWGCHLVL